MVPSLTTLFAWIALGETLQIHQMVGIGMITLGVVVLSFKSSASG